MTVIQRHSSDYAPGREDGIVAVPGRQLGQDINRLFSDSEEHHDLPMAENNHETNDMAESIRPGDINPRAVADPTLVKQQKSLILQHTSTVRPQLASLQST